jgi:hypothetical protein
MNLENIRMCYKDHPFIPEHLCQKHNHSQYSQAIASLFWVGIISIELLIIGLALKGI